MRNVNRYTVGFWACLIMANTSAMDRPFSATFWFIGAIVYLVMDERKKNEI